MISVVSANSSSSYPSRRARPRTKREPVIVVAEFSFFGRIRFLLAVILLAVLLEAALSILIPLGLYFFADRIVPAASPDGLYFLLGMVAGGALAGFAAGFLRGNLTARAQSRTLGALRLVMFDRMQRISLSFHAPDHGGTLAERFSSDLDRVEKAIANAIPQAVLPLTQAVLCTALMFWLDWRVALVGLLFWPWVILTPAAAAGQAASARQAAREGLESLLDVVRETVAAQSVVRLFGLEQTGIAGFRKKNEVVSRVSLRAGARAAFLEQFAGAGILSIQLLLFALNAWLTFNKQMTVGAFAAIQILAYVVAGSLAPAAAYLPVFADGRTAYQRVSELLEPQGAVKDMPTARYLPPLRSEIGFSDVSFSYTNDDQRQISDLTARIPRGAWVSFVGESGCGKSTILKLLMRFYDPSSGRITIDGHDLKSVTQASLRSHLGVVLQENSLFNISIRENIRIAKSDAPQEAVVAAARLAGLDEPVVKLPQGYDTVVGENGVRFLPAMIQRLALARAILREPSILLLDEVTSELDPFEEAGINAIIGVLRKGRTVISATHRLSTTAEADHIFVLDRGAIIEQGSHFELMALDGMYAYLWRKQAGFRFSADGTHVDVDAERLKAFPILENLDDAVLSELAPFFSTETFQRGREIVRQNDPGDKFYIIARGRVEVRRTEEQSGITAEVAILQDGDFFGEITLLTGFPRTATVRTLTACTCLSLQRGQFNKLLERFPELKRQVSEIALQRLRETSRAVTA